MHKTFVILRAIIALPTVLPVIFAVFATMALAYRIAHTDRERAAWLLLRLATYTRRTTASKPESKRELVASLVAPALLLQGAPWQRVRCWCVKSGGISNAFEFYFAEQRFDDARQAAQAWCEKTETDVAEQEDEMREFFDQHGDDLSLQKRGEIITAACQAELAVWEANPQGKRPGFLAQYHRVSPRIVPFFSYYDAHLALEATRWMMTRHPNSKSLTREFARQLEPPDNFSLPQFRVSDKSLRALGMNPTELAAIRCQAMGQ